MTQITIRPTPYHLTLPDNAPIKETAQIALAEWLKVLEATELQHLTDDLGFSVQVPDGLVIAYVSPHQVRLSDHYRMTKPDGSAFNLDRNPGTRLKATYSPDCELAVAMRREITEAAPDAAYRATLRTSPLSAAPEWMRDLDDHLQTMAEEAEAHREEMSRKVSWRDRMRGWLGCSR